MEAHRSRTEITVRAPAKLNLYFEVLAKRPDGFHEIETLMIAVRHYDVLRFRARAVAGIQLDCRWDEATLRERRANRANSLDDELVAEDAMPAEADNLAHRALRLLAERAGVASGADVELVKRIPAAAGLGGGSSDAAAALVAGNLGWNLNWPIEQLAALAGEIGSDVPFFLYGAAAVCRGRGERIEPCRRLAPVWVVIVKPAAGLSTAAVYRRCSPAPVGSKESDHTEQLAAALERGDWRSAGPLIRNRLESAAAQLSPLPERLGRAFAAADCSPAQLSGSGSSYFGICRHARHARRTARRLAAQRLGSVYVVTS